MAPAPRSPDFDPTRWSLVRAVASDDPDTARQALATLCENYWYPLYAHVRDRRHDADAAEDLTQGFFVTLLERDDLQHVHPERGRFRTFLLSALDNYLFNEVKHRQRLKRGGGQPILHLDFASAEGAYLQEPRHADTPDRLFDRRWALTVLHRVFTRLEREWTDAGEGAAFRCLKGTVFGDPPDGGYRELARQLDVTETTARAMAWRLRNRFYRLIHKELAKTVATKEAIDAEIQFLVKALRP
jgi:RNA polymerase sigma-70 factor (ECF subfamily)